MPYIETILESPKSYLVGRSALYIRSSIERHSTRKYERSLLQLEMNRMHKWQFIIPLSFWKIKELLAHLLFMMGLVNSALEHYIELKSYDKLIMCYMAHGRREKAHEVLTAEMSVHGETPKFLCLLGKINDDPEYYHKALDLSNGKCFRAFSDLGYYHLNRKNYAECVIFFEKALDINTIQPNAWYNLGCVYLELKKIDKAAIAFRTCCHLEPSNFKSWTNLSSILIQQNNYPAAYKAVQTAISCDYDHWQIWVKFAHICIHLERSYDVIRSFERLIELCPNNIDNQIVEFLTFYALSNENSSKEIQFKERLMNIFSAWSSKVYIL
ncbi:hypothetical protein HZS_6301 [Henneguya salminicola]|nr:hypothetical protein HZS_6301 [Henneguya salminicola]